MNRIISINIQGVVFQIEEDAFELLDQYLRKLKSHFKDQDGKDEILRDIETRIAEMLEREPGTEKAVSIERVKAIIHQMGDPAEFAPEEEESASNQGHSSAKGNRVLYRDPEDRWLGGVCSGLGAYFDLDPLWIRVAFLFAFFAFGTGFFLYIILWVLIPEAKTASERLEMKGQKVTIDTIEKTVKAEFDRLRHDFDESRFSENTKRAARRAANATGTIAKTGLKALSRVVGLGIVLSILIFLIFAGFAYFGFLVDLWRTPFFPFFEQLFSSSTTYVLYSLGLAGLFLLPLFGALYLGVRLFLGISSASPWIGRTLGGLWVMCLFISVYMVFDLSSSWSENAVITKEESFPTMDTLYIESSNVVVYNQKEYSLEFGRSRGIRGIYAKENGELKRPVKLNIQTGRPGSIVLLESRRSNGSSHSEAAELASAIQHTYSYEDKHFVFNPYYSVSENSVWKNQAMEYTLSIPEGCVVVFGSNTSTFLHHVSTDAYIHNSNLQGKSFIMTPNGLQTKNLISEVGEKGMQYAYSNFESVQLDGVPDVILFQSPSYTVYTEKGANYTPEFEMNGTRLR
ncbi:MAG: PspC domain-containing protein, partial [Bacteroidota bacterium]|nr:PspC domain-containing protein [Bacteroidota bacterium]MDX5430885.1 PspC domain-containing protein [Bacteroidota bacterium]MDX5469632.1 PspC domain-containing protein [Bacteroidota bacterium]